MHTLLSRLAAAAALAMIAGSAGAAEAPKSIRIGYAISLSGVNAQGAATTTLPGYELWVKDVNDKGGIMVKEFGKRIPVEVVAKYDDTSSAETLLRLEEKLMTQDKVDFVLPPWSTGFNLAVAPIFAKYGYPQLAVTANANDESDLVKQFPTLFFFLNQPMHFGGAMIGVLDNLKSAGKINNKIALLSVGDQFGAEFAAGFGAGLKGAGYEIVLEKSYPLGAADLTNEIKEAKAPAPTPSSPEAIRRTLSCWRGPRSPKATIPRSTTRRSAPLSPNSAAPSRARPTACSGIGGWDPNLPGAQEYYKRQVALTGHAPDGWASPVTYASLQILEQAIEKAGTLDRKKVLDTIANGGPWDTVSGPIDLKTHIRETAVGRRSMAERPVRRRLAERYGRRPTRHLPQAGVVTRGLGRRRPVRSVGSGRLRRAAA